MHDGGTVNRAGLSYLHERQSLGFVMHRRVITLAGLATNKEKVYHKLCRALYIRPVATVVACSPPVVDLPTMGLTSSTPKAMLRSTRSTLKRPPMAAESGEFPMIICQPTVYSTGPLIIFCLGGGSGPPFDSRRRFSLDLTVARCNHAFFEFSSLLKLCAS
ncbi:hypothetical protein BDV26DRAFT_170588 [Aspergillus bertholletiae]|uniref:Uncharacterized protein n=1 Tax=Aspergillus bertholletiae TaxID=1226010 RepID=A0A5N7BCF6_9EURO|nr:hypothetical protein BDV26DRAFT_170588 [Aspergillus bertholletiae]